MDRMVMDSTSARLSACGRYRYDLVRSWGDLFSDSGGAVGFVGLNPSVADEMVDDPTVRRCLGFARAWGFSGIRLVNLFAFRATWPEVMMRAADPVGPGNDVAIVENARACGLVVACWGMHGAHLGRGAAVRGLLEASGVRLHHLGLTAKGFPRHPLYLPRGVRPVRWGVGEVDGADLVDGVDAEGCRS